MRLRAISISVVLSALMLMTVHVSPSFPQPPMEKTAEKAVDLSLIDTDVFLPTGREIPSCGGAKWYAIRNQLQKNKIGEKSVTSAMNYFGVLEMKDTIEERERRIKEAEEELVSFRTRMQSLPVELESKRNELAGYREELADSNTRSVRRSRLERAIPELERSIAHDETMLADVEGNEKRLKSLTESIQKNKDHIKELKAMSPKDYREDMIMDNQAIGGIARINWLEDPTEARDTILKHDRLFEGAQVASIGEGGIYASKGAYNLRFVRGPYIVGIWMMSQTDKLSSKTCGDALARLIDSRLQSDHGISVEENPMTEHPYLGLVADGKNTLGLSVNLPDAMGSLEMERPEKGVVLESYGSKWEILRSNSIALTGEGKAFLRYQPPTYIKEKELIAQSPIHPKGEPDVWYAEEILHFKYKTKDGNDRVVDVPIRIFRPPVVFVHGFTGGLATWEWLDNILTDLKWDTQRSEYYLGSQSASEQSVLLHSNLQAWKKHYQKQDIKMKKADLVVHSMGGLISRNYISHFGKYDDDVRKLIMVATPNHGCNLTEKYIGHAASFAAGLAHEQASHDLYEASPFMSKLNMYESTGGHLNPEVQYAILYGRRHNYLILKHWSLDSYYPNDGVVSVDSALLNGVKAYRFDGTVHTNSLEALYTNDIGICEHLPVATKVEELLLKDIPRVPLANSDALLERAMGKVESFKTSWENAKSGTSVRRQGVRTGADGTAEIHFMQNGGMFAKLALQPDTEVRVFAASMRFIRVYLYKGRARLTTAVGEKSSVELVAGKGSNDLKFYPSARIIHVDTDLDVAVEGDDVHVFSRDGRVVVEYWDKQGEQQNTFLTSNEGVSLVGGIEPKRLDSPTFQSPGEAAEPGTSSGQFKLPTQLRPPLPPPNVSQTLEPMPVMPSSAAVMSGGQPSPDVTSGLLLSYDFTSTSNDKKVEDLSGNGYGGKLNGPVWVGRNGLYFDGKDDYIEVDGGERLHSDTALTVIGEFVTTSYTKKTWQNLVWKGNLPDGKGGASDCTRNCENREFALWLSNGAYLHTTSTAKDGVGRGQTYFNTPNGSVTGRTIFAQVIDSSTKNMKIFINGKEAVSQAYSSSGLRRTDGPLLIGGGGPINKGWSFRGYMRWLRIYNRALTDEEVAAITSRQRSEATEPWRDPYLLDDAVVKGGWATISPIQVDPYFDKFDLSAIEPGVTIQDGWFSTPNNRQETEVVYRHDGSPLRLAGHATVLDCLDYCGRAGSVEQIIRGDGRELWNSGRINQKGPGKDFDVDLTGVHEIRLVTTDGGNGDGEDWAAWLNLKLTWPDPKALQAPPPVPAMEPPIQPPRPIQITDASTSVGRVDSVYTLRRKPEGTPLVSIKHFPGETEEVVIWFHYQGFEAGDVLTGVWTDIGRQLQLRAVPVVMTNEQGATGFSLRRPVAGWARGNYLVEIKKGNKVLNSAKFNMDD